MLVPMFSRRELLRLGFFASLGSLSSCSANSTKSFLMASAETLPKGLIQSLPRGWQFKKLNPESQKEPFTSENIDSIIPWIEEQSIRLEEIYTNAFGELVEA